MLKGLREVQKAMYLLDYWFIIKGKNSGPAKMEGVHKARYVGRGKELPAFSG